MHTYTLVSALHTLSKFIDCLITKNIASDKENKKYFLNQSTFGKFYICYFFSFPEICISLKKNFLHVLNFKALTKFLVNTYNDFYKVCNLNMSLVLYLN